MFVTRPTITGTRGVLAAGHYLATMAGTRMFALGGNAVDAGVAAGFALMVVKPYENSLGGECPILIYSPKAEKVFAISGQGTAPQKATLEWFGSHNIKLIPPDGFICATVPALFGAYATALMRFGRLGLKDVLGPAIELCEQGFPMYEGLRSSISGNAQRFLAEWPSTVEVFMPDKKVPDVGQIIKQPALARTFRELAGAAESAQDQGREKAITKTVEYFYKGEIAKRILAFAHNTAVKDANGQSHTALLDAADFTAYTTRVEEPVAATYRQTTVYKCGPWTQGPVFLQQLKLLEGFDLAGRQHNSPEYVHTVIECAKLAFADRDRYYGDPLFSRVDLNRLLSAAYNDAQRQKVDPRHANNRPFWADPVSGAGPACQSDTTHLDVIDSDGWMMSATPSGGWIPASPVVPETGFPLGTRAQIFNLITGHPNCLQPGKRPRTTLTPSLAFKAGRPWMVFGTPGGDMQDQWTLQFFLNVVDFGMGLQEAMDAPSFHTTHFRNSFYPKNGGNGTIFIEENVDPRMLPKLREMGHTIELLPPYTNGQVCAVRIDLATGSIEGAASAKYDRVAYAFGW